MTLYEHMQKVSRTIFESGESVAPVIMLKDQLGKIKVGDAHDFFLEQNKSQIRLFLKELIKETNAIEVSLVTESWMAKVTDPNKIDIHKSLATQDVPERKEAIMIIYFTPHVTRMFIAEIDREIPTLFPFEEMPANHGNMANLHRLFAEI